MVQNIKTFHTFIQDPMASWFKCSTLNSNSKGSLVFRVTYHNIDLPRDPPKWQHIMVIVLVSVVIILVYGPKHGTVWYFDMIWGSNQAISAMKKKMICKIFAKIARLGHELNLMLLLIVYPSFTHCHLMHFFLEKKHICNTLHESAG